MFRTSESVSTSDPSQQKSDSPNRSVVAEFKVVLVGRSGVGKTAFLDRFGGEKKHDTTNGADIRSITFDTTIDQVQLNIWESPANIEPEELKEGFVLGADYGIIMFDFDDRLSYKYCPKWLDALRRVHGTLPVTLVGNKIDIQDKKIKEKCVLLHLKKNLPFNYISAKANFNIERPFVCIIRSLIEDDKLELIESPIQRPAEIMITYEEMQKFEEGFVRTALPPIEDEL